MWIRKDKVIVYDVEVFPNVFHCCCKDTETSEIYKFEISERKNQIKELVEFFDLLNELVAHLNLIDRLDGQWLLVEH